MLIEVDAKIRLNAPDEETAEKYVDEMLEDLSESTVLGLTYKLGTTRVVESLSHTKNWTLKITLGTS
jgi:aldehyde:ferredoxin oxidoreductase